MVGSVVVVGRGEVFASFLVFRRHGVDVVNIEVFDPPSTLGFSFEMGRVSECGFRGGGCGGMIGGVCATVLRVVFLGALVYIDFGVPAVGLTVGKLIVGINLGGSG